MKKFYFLFSLFFIGTSVFAQQTENPLKSRFPKAQIKSFFKMAEQQKVLPLQKQSEEQQNQIQSGAGQIISLSKKLTLPAHIRNYKKTINANDTLIVVDTMNITGTYFHNGPIIIFNGGLLHFKNANATILGDIYVWGTNSRLYADSSYLYIPQQYFYQRSLVVVDGGIVHYNQTTLDHSGLSHNLLAANNSFIEMIDVQNIGFTTNGVYGNAQIFINGTNEAGEYVTTDYSKLHFKNANTILLWHQFPDTALINFTFPDGDTVMSYHFNNTLPGIHGVEYSIDVDTCTNVMWGMMPVNGSDVTISNSKIRTIGLWFTGNDTIAVNGLVNNSHYTAFTADLSDRNLQLNNCDVQTWSIYPMDGTHVNLSGCIVGEVGGEQHSVFSGLNFTCDGSGGYMWASDTSFVLAGYCSAINSVRSQANGILLFAYSSLMGGYPMATGNSVIMVIQSSVQQEPVPLDNSCAWYAFIEKPFDTFVDTITAVTGSAWIDKTPTSSLMDFASKRLYYQANGASSWIEIPIDSTSEIRDDILGLWDTQGLTAGQYNIKLVLRDNWGNFAEAMKNVNLLPKMLANIEEHHSNIIRCFPNPANNNLTISGIEKHNSQINIYSSDGKNVTAMTHFKTGRNIEVDISSLTNGVYFIAVENEDLSSYFKFMKR